MDANKLRVLKGLPYKISRVCGMCTHSNFVANSVWGGCSEHAYDHLKHTEPAKPLSIHVFGSCPSFELGEGSRALKSLGAFGEVLEK